MENTGVIDTTAPSSEPIVVKTNEALEAACKRALDEVSALEMSQQVMAMIERSIKKPLVKDYNNTGVKKYLHELFTLSPSTSSEEVNGMEFIFWQEVQLWRSALSQRDSFISVSDLRHYCETSRPPLSEQALFALARFYRGVPASEKTTSKFDLIITRVFSKDEEDGARRLSASRTTVAETLNDLYKEWLGISPQNEEEKISQALTDLNEFIAKAEKTESFEALVADNFFGTIKDYKRGLSKVFYAPQVVAAAVDCNIRIGNRFIELLENYKQAKKAEGRAGDPVDPVLEEAVTETTNRSLKAVYEAKKQYAKIAEQRERQRQLEKETFVLPEVATVAPVRKTKPEGFFGINKWLLIGGLVGVLLSGTMYLWAEYGSADSAGGKSAQKLNEKELPGGEYLTAARVNNNSFFGIVTPKWNGLAEDAKKKVLGDLVSVGKEKGYSQVSLLNNDGRLVGQAGENGTRLF
ncbi:MAG TPA: hypothetical protein VGO50_03235 [Pyrinomonadaceae bacterium]|jgi:hypothetical protein|nr:hypothetical protein [Pyrinomonadaceae bacterium]